MQFKYRIDLRGEGHDKIASAILSTFDIESKETSSDGIDIVAWSRGLRLDELIGLSEVYPEAEMKAFVLQDANAIECSLINGEAIWEAEYDFALDMDPDLSCLCGITDDGCPAIPAIVPEAPSLLSTLECWGWKGGGIRVREYTQEEIAEKGLVTYPQMRKLIKENRSRVSKKQDSGKAADDLEGPQPEPEQGHSAVTLHEFYEEMANNVGVALPVGEYELTDREYHGQVLLDLRDIFNARHGAWNGTTLDFTEEGGLNVSLRKEDCDLIQDILNGLIERWFASLMI